VYSQKNLPFDDICNFKNNYAVVKTGHKYGFIDTTGTIVGSMNIDLSSYTSFHREKFGMHGQHIYISKNGFNGSGIKKVSGEDIFKPIYHIEMINDFFVLSGKYNTSLIIIVDLKGEIIYTHKSNPSEKTEIIPISKELFAITDKSRTYTKKYALINNKSELISDYKFQEISKLSDGLIKVLAYSNSFGESKWGFINEKGKTAIDFKFTYEPSDFVNGFAIYKSKSKKFGYINKSGNIVIKSDFELASHFNNRYAIVKTEMKFENNVLNQGYKIIDTEGNIIHNLGKYKVEKSFEEYADLKIEDNNMIRIQYKEKRGLLDVNSMIVKLTKFNRINSFNSGLALVMFYENNIKYSGYINPKGELLFKTKTPNDF